MSLASTGTYRFTDTIVPPKLFPVGSLKTKTGLQRDPRDTERRRVRHRDGRLLKAGMGLTTGLGWSDRLVDCASIIGVTKS